ncbi:MULTISPECIES: ParB/RepB/Spo0J family partition protein [Staphylococcus]|jgi:ParB family chromosome partitioning protein|uniref:ParB/RepB/Spo0J family partition protein n=1 Tax=Staphylococcus TaxID=1279 RepID=UPI000207C526|nr:MULTISPECIES: ParB/RepB/Spo0J family partition protein [Staphylococcus]EGG70668.1 stage 0 sporulation protein J [Staphylococcus epidermidis VCU028]EHQ81203.1 stage 0 sporulation protein J [Staphylococcus epidermidis VCU081]EJE45884.1 stage 0 sporulation protein J [Staphylococcus epidermidis NIH051475]KAB2175865.1 ParB/RepB/Spo0J family partition protein [Staphylococcus epidermidis]KAB2212714.1 ParB/RepB/Spo0J family partition protein [Staphylococcus epidermidis]
MAYTDDQRLKMNNDDSVQFIALELIRPNPYQPRKTFEEERLNDLASSIQQHGILQPIVLRQTVQGYYIVVGERRFRASQLAGLTEVPAIIKELSDEDMMELAIIENLQREDLNAIEEAESYKKMMTDLNITQQEVARRLGKSRPYIANMLRLLQLPKNVAQMVQQGALSSAHGRTLLTLKDASKIKKTAKQAAQESWSVRYLEEYVNGLVSKDISMKLDRETKGSKPKMIQQQERFLKKQYGAKVDISTSKNVGKITFEFKSEAEFKRLIRQLNKDYKEY